MTKASSKLFAPAPGLFAGCVDSALFRTATSDDSRQRQPAMLDEKVWPFIALDMENSPSAASGITTKLSRGQAA